jgi:uncharacterized protein YggE
VRETRRVEDDGRTRSINATGTGKALAVPDRAHFSFGMEVRESTASAALRAAVAAVTGVVTALRGAGVDAADLQTEQISLMPQTNDAGVEIVGYNAVSSVSARIHELEQAGAVVDAAVAAGANRVHGPSLTRADPSDLYRDALRAAYEDARAKAQVLAEAGGVTLGSMLSASEGGRGMIPLAAGYAADMQAVQPGTQEIQATATVTFAVI